MPAIPKSDTRKKRRRGPARYPSVWHYRVREWIEPFIVAIMLALIFRCFVVEAFQIPTGSLAPTLRGAHFNITCANCGFRFPRGVNGPLRGAVCPNCGHAQQVGPRRVRGGDRIFVHKNRYFFRSPERYDLIVFRCPKPGEARRNYIKRLIGLPGETMEISGGDIYAGGEIAPKPDDLQARIWIPVQDSRYVGDARRTNPERRWRPDEAGHWRIGPDGLRALAVDDNETWRSTSYGPVVNHSGYLPRPDPHLVRDLRLVVEAVPPAHGTTIELILASPSDPLSFAVERESEGRYSARLKLRDEVLAAGSFEHRGPGSIELSLATWDGEVRAGGGDLALKARLERDADREEAGGAVARIRVRGAEAHLSRVRVLADVYYIAVPLTDRGKPSERQELRGRAREEGDDHLVVDVPDDAYFALGDNSANSEDSRWWGFVPDENMIGKAFIVWYPLNRIGLAR